MATRVQIQVVLYEPELPSVTKLLKTIESQRKDGVEFRVVLGDCSIVNPCGDFRTGLDYHYVNFEGNLGFGAGHNRLASSADCDWLWFLNPDCLIKSDALVGLIKVATDDTGMVESLQIPFEHPKSSDPITGTTSWVSGCSLLVRNDMFHEVGGFDELFFMYCEDVDLSWRIRARGMNLRTAYGSKVYHRKSFAREGLIPTNSERTMGVASTLLLLEKYGFVAEAGLFRGQLEKSTDSSHKLALAHYQSRRPMLKIASGRERAVAQVFAGTRFAKHRWDYVMEPEPLD